MAKRRANGEGSIRKRKDGRWEGRYTAGHTPEGKAIYRNVLGKTQAEVVEKLRKAIEETKGLDVTKAGQYTLASGCGCGTRITPPSRCGPAPTQRTGALSKTTLTRLSARFPSPS